MNKGTVTTRKRLFLQVLRQSGNVSEACRAVRRSRATAYTWRAQDPAFAAAWGKALETAMSALEAEALRRVEDRPWTRKFSDQFVERLLRLHRPERYSKNARS